MVIVEGEGAVLWVNLGRPIITKGPLRRGSSQITLRTCWQFTTAKSSKTNSLVVPHGPPTQKLGDDLFPAIPWWLRLRCRVVRIHRVASRRLN